ncbi:MAG: c-type cytochrome [Acidobacteriota bacterium]
MEPRDRNGCSHATARAAVSQFDGRELGDLLAFLQAGASTADERVYVEPGSPRHGRELFAATRCIRCHMVAGEGGRGGPDLGVPERDMMRPVTAIAGSMWNHSQGMAAEFARRAIPSVRFSGQEMADIIAYLYFVNDAGVSGTPSRGHEVFTNRCAICHSVGSTGGIGPDLRVAPRLTDPIAIFTAMWNHAPRMEEELRRTGGAWPRLAPGDAADLAAFLLMQRSTAVPAARGSVR